MSVILSGSEGSGIQNWPLDILHYAAFANDNLRARIYYNPCNPSLLRLFLDFLELGNDGFEQFHIGHLPQFLRG